MKHTILILLSILAFSCTRKFYVAPKMAECAINGKTECFLIKSNLEENWVMIAEDIVGFELEEGFLYRILVKRIKIVDDFGMERSAYEIVEVISKEPYKSKKSLEDQSSIINNDYSLLQFAVIDLENDITSSQYILTWYSPED